MSALEFLARWGASNPVAAKTLEWVRTKGEARLQEEERTWFEQASGDAAA